MKEDLLEGVTFKMQSKVREQVSHASRRSGKNILGRENCKCEGPEEGNRMVSSRFPGRSTWLEHSV